MSVLTVRLGEFHAHYNLQWMEILLPLEPVMISLCSNVQSKIHGDFCTDSFSFGCQLVAPWEGFFS